MLATGRFATDSTGYRRMLNSVREQWPHRRWAVEGANGMGRPLAPRLLAPGDETVLDVPAKLAARVRVFDTGKRPQDRATASGSGSASRARTTTIITAAPVSSVNRVENTSTNIAASSGARTQTT